MHGKVYSVTEDIGPTPPLHPRCRCVIEALKARLAGTATMRYRDGADWWLKYNGMLPDYYVTLQDAKSFGSRPHPVVYGMKRILTIPKVSVTASAFYGQMTV